MTLYPFLISFIMVFIAELGDKTQFLILSFAGRVKTSKIIIEIITKSTRIPPKAIQLITLILSSIN